MDFFKPILSVRIDPSLKSYTVLATAIVPNGCYMNAGASPGTPKGETTVPEAQPITLRITRHDGPCTMGVQLLQFEVAWLPLSEGISSVIAFVTVDDDVVAVGSAPIFQWGLKQEGLREAPSEPMSATGAAVRSVNGWINAQPGGDPKLIVLVNVFAPCMNYQFRFTDLGPFGFTGLTLRVLLEAFPPDVCQKAIFEGPLRFERPLESAKEFDSVVIQFEGMLYFDSLETAV